MGDAKRVNLAVLRATAVRLRVEGGNAEDEDVIAEMLDDAIAEIEAARAAPAPSPTPSWLSSGSPPAIVMAALGGLRDIAYEVMGYVASQRDAGPSRAERLVRYRCAALTGLLACTDTDGGPSAFAKDSEAYVHAMLAAEREPQP